MPAEIGSVLKNAAAAVSQYIQDAAMMVVETKFIEIGVNGSPLNDQVQQVARTVICLDGDSETTIPMKRSEAGNLVVDSELFEIHQRNVSIAIEYRARILNSLVSALTQK